MFFRFGEFSLAQVNDAKGVVRDGIFGLQFKRAAKILFSFGRAAFFKVNQAKVSERFGVVRIEPNRFGEFLNGKCIAILRPGQEAKKIMRLIVVGLSGGGLLELRQRFGGAPGGKE